jgi:hypothetical protein
MGNLQEFLMAVFEHGLLKVPAPQVEISTADREAALMILHERAAFLAADYPGEPPVIDEPAATWAALMLLRASQAAVYRDLSAEQLEQVLSLPAPDGKTSSHHWSVDISFAFLPELAKFVRAANASDPLLAILQSWAATWPLSGMSLGQVTDEQLQSLQVDQTLWQYYLERLVARRETKLRDVPAIRTALTELLGTEYTFWK